MNETDPNIPEAEQSLKSRLALPVGMITVGACMAGGSVFATYESIAHKNEEAGNFGVGIGFISLGVGLVGAGARSVWNELHPRADYSETSENSGN